MRAVAVFKLNAVFKVFRTRKSLKTALLKAKSLQNNRSQGAEFEQDP
jgi:hypothetical protein